jgi:DNA polymerase elongation subunit (family B)
MQYNMSPETIASGETTQLDVDSILQNPNIVNNQGKAVAANGQYFNINKLGVLPKIINDLYSERVDIKQSMLKAQQELQKADKNDKQDIYRIERDITINENRQMAIKILLNSLYGALGNKYFRFFDQRIAEGPDNLLYDGLKMRSINTLIDCSTLRPIMLSQSTQTACMFA